MDLFICFEPSIYSTVACPPLGISDHVIVSVSINIPLNLGEALFIAQLMVILMLIEHASRWFERCCLYATSTKFVEWAQVGIDVPHPKYINPYSSPWFSAACVAAIVHRDYFFHLHRQNESSACKVMFTETIND